MLTLNNYHSRENNNRYMSFSTFKSLAPTFGGCESKGMAVLDGEVVIKVSPDMLTGSYVDAYMSGTLEPFIEDHPEMFSSQGKTKGQLKSVHKPQIMDQIFNIIDNDLTISKALTGDKQDIGVAEWHSVEWKYAIDCINHEQEFITDLKIVREIYAKTWCDTHYEFNLAHFGYFHQVALYCHLDKIANNRSRHYTPYLAVISKEDPPDKALINIFYNDEQFEDFLNEKLLNITSSLDRVISVWKRELEPIPCGACDYCRKDLKMTKTVSYTDFEL